MLLHPMMPFVTEEIWSLPARRARPAGRRAVARGRRRAARRGGRGGRGRGDRGRHRAAPLPRRGRRAAAGPTCAAASWPTATRASRDQIARLARFEFVEPSVAGAATCSPDPRAGGAVQVLPSDAIDAEEAGKRIAARREQLRSEIERAERKLAQRGLREEGAGGGGRRGAPQARRVQGGAEPARRMNAREAEEYLLGLELFGMRFGLDRMHKLMTVLGLPQRRFASVHVVGSNGKSSTVRMIRRRSSSATGCARAATPRRTCARSRERIEVGEEPISDERFAAAVAAARPRGRAGEPDRCCGRRGHAVRGADRSRLPRAGAARGGGGGDRGRPRRPLRRDQRDPVEGAGGDVASGSSTRAGWGRRSPTSPRRSWRSCATTGRLSRAPLAPDARAVAERVVAERHARLVAPAPFESGPARLRALGAFQRAQLRPRRARPPRRSSSARSTRPRWRTPPSGRASPAASSSWASARSRSTTAPTTPTGRPRWPRRCRRWPKSGGRASCVVSVLEDKDAAGMLRALLPLFDRVDLHPLLQPALAVAGHARVAGRAARRPAVAGRVRSARRRRAPRASSRARTAPWWPRARST